MTAADDESTLSMPNLNGVDVGKVIPPFCAGRPPDFGVSQHTQDNLSFVFRTIQAEHSHSSDFFKPTSFFSVLPNIKPLEGVLLDVVVVLTSA